MKAHSCKTCGKSFTQKTHLNAHLCSNKLIKSFPCSECQKSFTTNAALRKHFLTHKSFNTGGNLTKEKNDRILEDSLKSEDDDQEEETKDRASVFAKSCFLQPVADIKSEPDLEIVKEEIESDSDCGAFSRSQTAEYDSEIEKDLNSGEGPSVLEDWCMSHPIPIPNFLVKME